ncbi:MAG: fatty acid desaturase family protein [Bacteriovoracaceae bacterium]
MNEETYKLLAKDTESMRPDLTSALFEVLLQTLILVLGFWLSTGKLWIAGQIILGIAFWRSFAILHACGHHAFSTKRRLDDVIGLSQSLFCFIPYYSWKFIHFDHHRWTGWLDLDPTMRNLEKGTSKFNLAILNFCWKLWIPVISIHYIVTVFFTKNNSHRKLASVWGSILFVLLAHGTTIYFLGWNYFRYFGLSSFIYLNLGDVSLLTQHVHLPMDHSRGSLVMPKRLWEQDQYSHTVELPLWMTRWLVLGFNHHSLHHLFPTMPYYHSSKIKFQGKHTHQGWQWLKMAKSMKATDLIYSSSP